MTQEIDTDRSRIVIGVDPHKASWTAAVIDSAQRPLATIRVPVSDNGYRSLRRFARKWANPNWAIEGATDSAHR